MDIGGSGGPRHCDVFDGIGRLGHPNRALDAVVVQVGMHVPSKHGWKVDAFDLSPESIHQANDQPAENINYHVMDLRKLAEKSAGRHNFIW